MHYQPRVSFDGRTGLVGFEALLRWAHPDRGLLCPGEFIADAERTGLVLEIGDWVIGEALAQVHRWRQSRPGMTISVNLSHRQLLDPSLAGRLRARLRGYGMPASTLWLEVAESAILADPAAAARALRDLHEVGVLIAVDEVGRDEAAPPELRELPVAMLKIDRGVVSRVDDADGGRHVEGVVGLGHRLGLSVVAEGVETDHQLAHIRELGCDGAQGFLFSRPVPEDSVAELLGSR